jgi:hypothetical protein
MVVSLGRLVAAVALVAFTAIALVAGGCGGSSSSGSSGGSSSSGGGGPDAATFADLCKLSAQSTCDQSATCDAKSFRYPSVDACVTAQLSLCALEGQFQGLLGGTPASGAALGLAVNWDAFLDCTKKKIALGPSCKPPPSVTSADVLAARAACVPGNLIGPGSRAAGAPCYVEMQCQPGLTCSTNTAQKGDAGICGACVSLQEGASCQSSSECGLLLGMECDAKTNACMRYAKAGEACDVRTCDPAAFLGCDRATKKCAPLATSGQSCASLDCDTGLFLYCGIADHTCKPIPRNVGDSCKTDMVCGGGLFCDATTFTCLAVRGAGASCASPDGAACDANQGLACDPAGGTCVSPYGHPGDACGSAPPNAKPCWQSVCVQDNPASPGTCVAYGVAGSPCAASGAQTCADTYECRGGVCTSFADELRATDAAAFADATAALAACQ